ncbi:MAG TPA: radical SAM protein [Fervidobacterium sp.]|nr:radical SAM protein [Fervidobacterium sp.]
MKLGIHFFGCKVNQYDAARWIIGLGENHTSNLSDADIIVLFSCVVTHKAEAEVRRFVQKWRAAGKRIILTGCGTNITLTDLADEGVTLVPIQELDNFMKQLGNFYAPSVIPFYPDRSRGFVKVEDGCSWRCAYCVSALERGEVRSRPLDEILREICLMSQRGISEVVITGTNLMLWREGQSNYLDLIESVSREAARENMRVRLSSVYPEMVNRRMIELFSLYPLARHLHISLQSASDRVLKTMNRAPLRNLAEMLAWLKNLDGGFAFTADIIVGYPTETEQDFLMTMSLLSELRFSKVHVFPFSVRPNTAASRMRPLQSPLVKRRAAALNELSETLKDRFIESQKGSYRPAVFLRSEGLALTDNYIYVPSQPFSGIKRVPIVEGSYII